MVEKYKYVYSNVCPYSYIVLFSLSALFGAHSSFSWHPTTLLCGGSRSLFPFPCPPLFLHLIFLLLFFFSSFFSSCHLPRSPSPPGTFPPSLLPPIPSPLPPPASLLSLVNLPSLSPLFFCFHLQLFFCTDFLTKSVAR